jgi:hypothetical protein
MQPNQFLGLSGNWHDEMNPMVSHAAGRYPAPRPVLAGNHFSSASEGKSDLSANALSLSPEPVSLVESYEGIVET